LAILTFTPEAPCQQLEAAPIVEYRTISIEVDLRNDPKDPDSYLLKIPAESKIDILHPEITAAGLDTKQWYEVRYLDELGWVLGEEIEVVLAEPVLQA